MKLFGKQFYEEVKEDVVKSIVEYLIEMILKKLTIKVRNINGKIVLTEIKAGDAIDIDLVDHENEPEESEKLEE